MVWQPKLLQWYRKHRRDLPWRRTWDPYAIWVSEIMLQQTTVEAVIPYYEKFLKRFPTIADLAEAGEEEVLRFWSGLGYYSRARNLHKAVQSLYRGAMKDAPTLPSSVEELRKLPGIGRYTAGAIASIAFDQKVPILDGNVMRVLSRLFRMKEDPKSTPGQKIFWKKSEEILPEKNCGDFNQALMELGATVCVPENPLCLICPLQSSCESKKRGDQDLFPQGKKKINYRDQILTAAVIQKGQKFLMIQRKSQGLLKGMWEFPMVEGDTRTLLKGWPVKPIKSLSLVRHSVLDRRLKITPWLCRLTGDLPKDLKYVWISPPEIENLPSSSMNRKILTCL